MRQGNVALISVELRDEVERGLLRRRSSRLTIKAGIPALSSSCLRSVLIHLFATI